MNETITSSINDVVTIQWSILTSGGESVKNYNVDWVVPGANQFVSAPGGTVQGDATYLEISLGRVIAGRDYQYRIQAVNNVGYVSEYVFYRLRSSKGV